MKRLLPNSYFIDPDWVDAMLDELDDMRSLEQKDRDKEYYNPEHDYEPDEDDEGPPY